MKSHDGIIVGGEEIGCEVVLEPLDILELDHNYETSHVQKADLSLLRRFDIACGEVKYFKPETVISKHGIPTLESNLKPKSISPKCCTCIRLQDKKSENCRWLEEFRRKQSQLTIRSINLLEENFDQLTLLSSEGERSNIPTTSMVDNVVDSHFPEEDHGQKISSLDVVYSREGPSFYEIDKKSIMNDDSSNHLTSLDSSSPYIPASELRCSPTISLTPNRNLIENFSNKIKLHEEKTAKTSVLVSVNTKRKNQYFLNNESRSNSCTPKFSKMSKDQPHILVNDDEVNVAVDVEKRQKSLICAAKVVNLSKFKWRDLDLEDLDNMQVVSKNGNMDTKSAIYFEEVRKYIGLDAQEIAPLDIEQEIQGFDPLSGEKEQRRVFSLGQQINFPRFVVPDSDLQGEVDVLAKKTSIYEDCKENGSENLFAKTSKESRLRAYNAIEESTCESQSNFGLALLATGEVDFCLSPIAIEMKNAEVKKFSKVVDSANLQFNSHNKRDSEQIIEFFYMNQLKKYQNLGSHIFMVVYFGSTLRDFVKASLPDVAFVEVLDNKTQDSNRDVSVIETPQYNKHNLKEELGNKDVLSSNDIAVVPIIAEVTYEDPRAKNIGVEKAKVGKEFFLQHLWCYLFENMKRTIDELYFLCEFELDVEHIKEALLVLDEACAEFKGFKARVDGSDRVNKVPNLSQPSFATSTKGDFPQRLPRAIPCEVRRMACSQEQVNNISSSLEAVKKVHGSLQSGSLQDRRQCDTCGAFENLLFQDPTFTQVVVSPKQTQGLWKKASLVSNSELLTNKTIGSSSKRSTPNSSSINRFLIPITSSEQRAFSREQQLNVPISSNTTMEAWKENENWEDIPSSPLNSSSQISSSLEIGQKNIEQVYMLHKKFVSPKWKKRSLLETKKEVDGKQSCTTPIRMELENEKVQHLQKVSKKSTRVNEWQAVRNNKLQRGMHSKQQSRETWHEAHLAHISRRASDKSSKVNEVCFITSLHEKNKKLVLQLTLEDLQSRQIERLQSMRLKHKEGTTKEEDAQEKRHHLEVERLQRIVEVQQRKDRSKARQEEERKVAIVAREAPAIEHIWKKESWAKVQQEEGELLEKKLLERFNKSSLQRKMYLEQIRECTMINFGKQENCSEKILNESYIEKQNQGSPSCRQMSKGKISSNQSLESGVDTGVPLDKSTSGRRWQAGAGLINLVESHNKTSLQANKKNKTNLAMFNK